MKCCKYYPYKRKILSYLIFLSSCSKTWPNLVKPFSYKLLYLTHFILICVSCEIFEHFAVQVDPVIEFFQLRSTPFKDSAILVQKLADPPFWWKKLDSIPSKSRSRLPIQINSYFVVFKDVCYWNSVLRSQFSLCQRVFYYMCNEWYQG
jgi:hypothetical protein